MSRSASGRIWLKDESFTGWENEPFMVDKWGVIFDKETTSRHFPLDESLFAH